MLLPAVPPSWTFAAGFPERLAVLLARGRGETTDLSGQAEYAAATSVGDTGLRMLLVAEEAPLLAPVRWRFFWQMLLVLVGQALTVVLFSWFLRRDLPPLPRARRAAGSAREDGRPRPRQRRSSPTR